MKRINYRLAIVVLVGLISFSALGCAQVVDNTLSGAIKRALPQSIGSAESYDVKVNSDPIEAAKGHIREVDITGIDVNLSPTLLIDELDIAAHGVTANTSTRKLKSIESVQFRAVIGQDTIDHYLLSTQSQTPSNEKDIKVTLNDSSVTASFSVKWLGVWVPVSVTGTFELNPDNHQQIFFVPTHGSVSIIPVPEFAVRLAVSRVNPVIDLSTSAIPVEVGSLSIQSGTLNIAGTADLNKILEPGS